MPYSYSIVLISSAVGCFGDETLQALLLPASSQCFIQLNHRQQFILACLYDGKFRRESVSLVRQDFQIARDAAGVTHVGKTRGILRRLEQEFFLLPKFSGLPVRHQCVGYTAKGGLN